LPTNGIQSFKWLNCIESIFNDVGLSYIFENQIGFIDVKYITQILHDLFSQKWFSATLSLQNVQVLSCLGIFAHLPVSVGIRRLHVLNFVIHIYEKLGQYPLEIRVKIRMISFWNRLVNNN
jgi:hypothetical protein